MNGRGSGSVVPSIVTWYSCIASSRADCVLAGARLISSASSTWQKIGPLRRTNSFVLRSKMEVPVTSDGSRSGVNWTRGNWQPRRRANVFDSVVLATPGTPSSRTWPPAEQGDQELLGDLLHADDDLADFLDHLLGQGLAVGGEFLGGFGTGDGRWGHATRGRGPRRTECLQDTASAR